MDRKEIVRVLGEHIGIKPKYLGVPSFAYQVGEYTVDREGRIRNKVGDEAELEDILNSEKKTTDLMIALPMEGHNGKTLRNLVNMIYSRQVMIKKVFEIEENIVEGYFITAINHMDVQTTSQFIYILKERGVENCSGINFEEDKITFNITKQEIEPEEIKAFADFLSLLNKKAKELKYASDKQVNTDNEKYAFRTWLMRLGMIGDEYKATRKVLLQNLSGNGAFRKPGESHEAKM